MNDVGCLLGPARGGSNSVICPCPGDRDVGACTSLSCDADAATIQSACAARCPEAAERAICAASSACAAGEQPAGRDKITCTCGDGTRPSACTVGVCGELVELDSECAALCDGHGDPFPGEARCDEVDASCALGGAGENGVSCNCESAFNVGGCTALDCDADAASIQQACDDACAQLSIPPGGSAPVCTADASCAAGGSPGGPAQSFCHCADDVFFEICSAGCVDCEGSCADHGGLSERLVEGCSAVELACVLGGAGGPSAVACTCNNAAPVVRCGDVACDDASAVAAVCDEACSFAGGQSASPSCAADDQGCAAGGPPYGPSLADCGCGDGTHVTTCVADCGDSLGVVGRCFGACHDHGGFETFSCEPDATSCP